VNDIGSREGTDGLPDLFFEGADELLGVGLAFTGVDQHVAVDALPLDGMGVAHHGGLGHGFVRHQCALHFGGA